MTRILTLEPLTAEAFAPFGDVVAPPVGQRLSLSASLQGVDGAMQPRLSFNHAEPWTLPLTATKMERRNRSSQCFVPIDVTRWVVLVAPDDDGKPDIRGLPSLLEEYYPNWPLCT